MGAFAEIDNIFNIALLNAALGGIVVVTENLDYSPQSGVPYVAGYLLPAPTVQASLGRDGCDNHSGLYQIDINYPKDNGTTDLKVTADLVNQVFFSGAVFTLNNVVVNIRNVSIDRVVIAGGWATLSTTIEYYSYTQRI